VCCKNDGGVCWLQAFAAVLRRPVAREMERLRAGWLLLLRCCDSGGGGSVTSDWLMRS
jgi:hypothetical protein